jgi:hypothetical protein
LRGGGDPEGVEGARRHTNGRSPREFLLHQYSYRPSLRLALWTAGFKAATGAAGVTQFMRFVSLDGVDWIDTEARKTLEVGTAITDFVDQTCESKLQPVNRETVDRVFGPAALAMRDGNLIVLPRSLADEGTPKGEAGYGALLDAIGREGGSLRPPAMLEYDHVTRETPDAGKALGLLDLMVYAVAKERGEPLLCTGRDFATTDLVTHAASRM